MSGGRVERNILERITPMPMGAPTPRAAAMVNSRLTPALAAMLWLSFSR
jgi:hypothetical protein